MDGLEPVKSSAEVEARGSSEYSWRSLVQLDLPATIQVCVKTFSYPHLCVGMIGLPLMLVILERP